VSCRHKKRKNLEGPEENRVKPKTRDTGFIGISYLRCDPEKKGERGSSGKKKETVGAEPTAGEVSGRGSTYVRTQTKKAQENTGNVRGQKERGCLVKGGPGKKQLIPEGFSTFGRGDRLSAL